MMGEEGCKSMEAPPILGEEMESFFQEFMWKEVNYIMPYNRYKKQTQNKTEHV